MPAPPGRVSGEKVGFGASTRSRNADNWMKRAFHPAISAQPEVLHQHQVGFDALVGGVNEPSAVGAISKSVAPPAGSCWKTVMVRSQPHGVNELPESLLAGFAHLQH